MRHATESEIVRAADGALAADERAAFEAHVASCASCAGELESQRAVHGALARREIAPVRDLSGPIRAALDAERPWIERLNWRRLSLRVAPVAAALTLVALLLVRTVDAATTATPAAETTPAAGHSVASALWSGEVSDDQLLTLILRARPDESLSTYVQEK